MKRFFAIFSCFIFLVPLLLIPSDIKADSKTLQQLLDDLTGLENKFQEIADGQGLTVEEVSRIRDRMIEVGLKLEQNKTDIMILERDIKLYNEEIVTKEARMKNLVRFLQITKSDNEYLDFAFGADDISSFIYRLAIVEQLLSNDEEMIKDLNGLIKEKEKAAATLASENESLEIEKEELIKEQEKLGDLMNILDENSRSIRSEMFAARATINNYKNLGCSLSDTLESCSKIPQDKAMKRPLTKGFVTSGYGLRENPVYGSYHWHYGVDIGGNAPGTPVYSVAAGTVVYTYVVPSGSTYCGGNYIIIQHNIEGTYYATRYMHLSKVLVGVGQTVTSETIIGAVGGTESYDTCSTGAHLDFTVAQGIYGSDFWSFREPYTVNPYFVVNLPAEGVDFSGR